MFIVRLATLKIALQLFKCQCWHTDIWIPISPCWLRINDEKCWC